MLQTAQKGIHDVLKGFARDKYSFPERYQNEQTGVTTIFMTKFGNGATYDSELTFVFDRDENLIALHWD